MATLVVVLLRVRTLPRPVAWLVAVPAWHVAWWNVGTALTGSALGKTTVKDLRNPVLPRFFFIGGQNLVADAGGWTGALGATGALDCEVPTS